MAINSDILDIPVIMGILNVTPDSFYDGGRYNNFDAAKKQAEVLLAAGADIIDVGGESTRPGAVAINATEELHRVLPILEWFNKYHPQQQLSIDTSQPLVMREAVARGASMINDVRALALPDALATAAELGVTVCLMHMQNNPENMQLLPKYNDVIADVKNFLAAKLNLCKSYGIDLSKIYVDPGFGFGKTMSHNFQLLQNIKYLKSLNCKILVGLSRKAMFGKLLGIIEEQRLPASIAANVIAYQNGAKVFRVHDVAATKQALLVVREAQKYLNYEHNVNLNGVMVDE